MSNGLGGHSLTPHPLKLLIRLGGFFYTERAQPVKTAPIRVRRCQRPIGTVARKLLLNADRYDARTAQHWAGFYAPPSEVRHKIKN
jgi:hypothetical protein